MPGSGLPVRLQGLIDDHYADAIELLTLADSEADVPAPNYPAAETDTPQAPAATASAQTEAPALDPVEHEMEGTEPESGSGPSLADVLADSDDQPQEPESPAAGTADVAFPLTTHALTATPPGPVRATIPTPAPEPVQPQVTLTKTVPQEQTTAPAPACPRILLLGPVTVEGAVGRVDSNRKRPSTEVAAYLGRRPPCPRRRPLARPKRRQKPAQLRHHPPALLARHRPRRHALPPARPGRCRPPLPARPPHQLRLDRLSASRPHRTR